MSWTHDNAGFFYSRFDAPASSGAPASAVAEVGEKPGEEADVSAEGKEAGQETEKLQFQKVFYHRVGTKQVEDVLVYEDRSEPDRMFSMKVTNDGKYLLLKTVKDCEDLAMIGFADITDNALTSKISFTPLINEWLGGFTYIHNIGSSMYFKTNYSAPRSKVIMIDVANFNGEVKLSESMHEVIPEHASNVLNEAECINGMIVAYYLENASDKMVVFDLESVPAKELHSIQLPGIGSVVSSFGKCDSSEFFFKFSSFSDPGSAYRVDMTSFEVETIATTQLKDESIDIADYITD